MVIKKTVYILCSLHFTELNKQICNNIPGKDGL